MKLPLVPINLALAGVIFFIGWDTTKTWLLELPLEEDTPITAIQEKKKEEKNQPKKRKHLRQYAMIGKKNLFRPEREEWKPPPPPPPVKPEPPPPPPEKEEPPPPPALPNPTLDGIIILSETNKIALMKGSHRESPASASKTSATKSRFRGRSRGRSTTGRSTRPGRVITGETGRYRIGDEISEMTIEDIVGDRVVLRRTNGEKVEIFLRTVEKTARHVSDAIKEIKKRATPARSTGTKTSPRSRSSRFRRRSSRRPRSSSRVRTSEDLKRALE